MTIAALLGKNIFLLVTIAALLMQDYLAPEIISHFVMHGTSLAETVKHLITVLKKTEDDLAAIFLEALKKAIVVLDVFLYIRDR